MAAGVEPRADEAPSWKYDDEQKRQTVPMRVIVNDRPLQQTLTGVGHYIAQLLSHVPDGEAGVALDPFLFTYLLRRDWRARAAAPTAAPPRVGSDGAGRVAGRDISRSRWPWFVRRALQGAYATAFRTLARGYDLYHEPNHIPLRTRLPTVTTVHDLSVIEHPEWHPADRVAWYEREFMAGVRRTRTFLAASEFTRRQMVARLGVEAERIFVSYQAPRPAFYAREAGDARMARERHCVPDRFFLYVGTLEPRKNVVGLLDAYGRLPEATRRACPLLVVGAWGWKQQELRAKLAERRLDGCVRLMGFLQDDELAGLYSTCTALVWPTLYEGFGLPPLEAMACGAPVIVSDVASLPEVVGDAGVRLAPGDVAAWTGAMQRMVDDDATLAARRAASLAQAATFSWGRFAAATMAAYRAALGQDG